jgi:glycosyltransferase involved in cell wall biosynthesis
VQGKIEAVTRNAVKGWAWVPGAPQERVRLELLEDGVPLATAVANLARADLSAEGIGDGQYGFEIELKPDILSGAQHVLHLRCAETGAAVQGSPMVIMPARESVFPWNVDAISDSGIEGWILQRDAPSKHCVVSLKEGGRTIAQTIASQFRNDLVTAGVGDGCHAFKLEMPRRLLDGEEHVLSLVEQDSSFPLTEEPIQWRSGAGTAEVALTGRITKTQQGSDIAVHSREAERHLLSRSRIAEESTGVGADGVPGIFSRRDPGRAQVGTRIMFDISDLVYYVGHHANLTGIQRVQSSIVLSIIQEELLPYASAIFLSFNAKSRNWVMIPTGFLLSLLQDLFLPEEHRLISFSSEEARYGILPGGTLFDGTGVLALGKPSVLCLLGAAWIHQDYLYRVLDLKRRFGTRFVMAVHDLIPIYARETCDQDTARVFEDFMRSVLRHVDHVLAVSENTAKDVRRFHETLKLAEPRITVTKNGSSFAEFLPAGAFAGQSTLFDLPERFVLFVATIEGRKNHQLMFEIWRRMVEGGDDPPTLICVGRLGWKATRFIGSLVETNYLDGRVMLLRDVSDTDLRLLYDRCMFTVCPSLYEGWGLTVGESLAMGKICVSSDRASIPEVVGNCGVFIDIDSVERSLAIIRELIRDSKRRGKLESKIRRDYVPVTWRSVAERVVAACEAATEVAWQEPYPYAAVPYSTEISFGQLDRDTDGTGDFVLTRIVDARAGYFRPAVLDIQSFQLGEEIRSFGSWASPERWGSWLCHSGGELMFSLEPDPSQLYYVFQRLRVFGWLSEQPVRLLANGEQLWHGKIGPQPRDIMLRVRKPASTTGRWKIRLAAEVDVSPDIKSQIAAADSRIPTIGFERLIVVPETDLTARLDAVGASIFNAGRL